MSQRQCRNPTCDVVIPDDADARKIYCSRKCNKQHFDARRKAVMQAEREQWDRENGPRICANPKCNNEIPPGRHPGVKYCDPQCYRKFRSKRPEIQHQDAPEAPPINPAAMNTNSIVFAQACAEINSRSRRSAQVSEAPTGGGCALCGKPIPHTRAASSIYCSERCQARRNTGPRANQVSRFYPGHGSRNPDATERTCLGCGEPFPSDHVGNRICDRCKTHDAWDGPGDFAHRGSPSRVNAGEPRHRLP